MDRRYLGLLIGFAAAQGSAQTPATQPAAGTAPTATGTGASSTTPQVLVSTSATDVINLNETGLSVPLRHGGVLPNSVHVALNGTNLQKDVDYTIDYAGGVVYLSCQTRSGDSLTVNYRYSKDPAATNTSVANKFKFDLLPGSLNMTFGFGMAERGANGQVQRANVFGWQNNFTMKGGSAGVFQGGGLTGLFMVDQHQSVTGSTGFDGDASVSSRGSTSRTKMENQSRLILQNFTSGFLGGKVALGYQDVSKDFAAFSAGSGVDQKAMDQLSKEKGLQRQSFGLSDISVLGLKLTDDYKSVSDSATHSGITWRDLGVKQGAFNFAWNNQKVDSNFSRFNDLGEANKADLQHGVGLDRQTITAGMGVGKAGAVGAFAFSGLSIEGPYGGRISKQDGSYTSKKFSVDFGQQEVQSQFISFGNLTPAETPIYQQDGGLRRQWFALKSDFGRGYTPSAFSESWVKSDTGQLVATDANVGGKGWSVTHTERDIDPGFTSFAAITPADQDAHIKAIGSMYGPKLPNGQALNVNPAGERGFFSTLEGLQRRFDGANFQPFKDTTATVGRLNLQGNQGSLDKGDVETASVANKKYTVTYFNEDLNTNFNQLPMMMGFERQYLGTIQGLRRTDLGFSADLGKGQSFTYNSMEADAGTGTGLGNAVRRVFDLKEKTFEISYNHRSVADTFTRVNELVDPENAYLSTLVGYDQTDLKIKGTALKANALKFDAQLYNDSNSTLNQSTVKNSVNLSYDTGTTSLAYTHLDQKSNDPLQILLGQVSNTFSLAQKFGNSFKLHVAESDAKYDGTQSNNSTTANGIALTDSSSRTVGLEYKLNATTNVATEFTDTDYGNGEKSSVRNDSLSKTISKRAGLTLSESVIDNPTGQLNNQTKRNYGFWYDLGKGMIFNYGYVRQLDTTGFSTLNSIVSIGQAPAANQKPDQLAAVPASTFDNLNFAGGYAANQWQTPTTNADGTVTQAMRTQSFSNFRIATAKPMKFGQVSDFKFNVGLDTAADNYNWIRENRDFGVSGKYGATGFGFAYKSQIDSLGDSAVDRMFSFTSDASAKKFISASISYKVRSLPQSMLIGTQDRNVMIRNYDVTIRPSDRLSISTQLLTNPEVTNGGVLLGSVTQGSRVDRWKATYASTKDTDFGLSWEENINESNLTFGHTAGLNFTFFKSTSPLKFFYGYESFLGNQATHSTERWSFQFDQRPGANQSFNIFVGNVAYGYTLNQGQSAHNLTARVDYIWRF